jgi:hypothetical protein
MSGSREISVKRLTGSSAPKDFFSLIFGEKIRGYYKNIVLSTIKGIGVHLVSLLQFDKCLCCFSQCLIRSTDFTDFCFYNKISRARCFGENLIL